MMMLRCGVFLAAVALGYSGYSVQQCTRAEVILACARPSPVCAPTNQGRLLRRSLTRRRPTKAKSQCRLLLSNIDGIDFSPVRFSSPLSQFHKTPLGTPPKRWACPSEIVLRITGCAIHYTTTSYLSVIRLKLLQHL